MQPRAPPGFDAAVVKHVPTRQHMHTRVCVTVSPAVTGDLVCAADWLLERLKADRAARVEGSPTLSEERVQPRAERRGLGRPYWLAGPARQVG